MLLKCVCEVCGKVEILNSQEAFEKGWDYPPKMGRFGVISPRTCGSCSIDQTLWWAIMCEKTPMDKLNERHKATLARILNEPKSILVDSDGENKIMKFDPIKYVIGDIVEFEFKKQLVVGTIVVSDYGGAYGFSSNTYDISTHDILYKHVEEKFIMRIIKKTDRLIYQKERIEMFLGLLEEIEKENLEKLKRNHELVELNKNIRFGKYLVFTKSGSKYLIQFGENKTFMIRKNKRYELRKDSQKIKILFLDVRIGLPAFFILDSLGEDSNYTIRQTTRVIEIKKFDS